MPRRSRVPDFIVNPSLRFRIGFTMRTRGVPLRRGLLAPEIADEMYMLLREGVGGRGLSRRLARLPAQAIEELIASNLLVRRADAPRDVAFESSLSPSLLDWIPTRARARVLARGELVVTKGLVLQTGERPPKEMDKLAGTKGHLVLGRPTLWVKQPGTGAMLPYGLTREHLPLARALVRSKGGRLRTIENLEPALLDVLVNARILVPRGWDRAERRRWQEAVREGRAQVRRDGFTVARGLLAPLFLGALRKYFRALEEEGYLEYDERQVKRQRLVMHNEPVLCFVHHQLAALIRSLSGEATIPSYTYLSAYLPGAVLKRHVDRRQCAWNVSLHLDSNPETALKDAWPISLTVRGRTVSAKLEIGDGILYRGTDVPHWRAALGRARRETMGLLHFVIKGFRGSLD